MSQVRTAAISKDRTGFDLVILTAFKLAAIAALYFVLFAAYDGRPVDTLTHLLGPVPASQNSPTQRGP